MLKNGTNFKLFIKESFLSFIFYLDLFHYTIKLCYVHIKQCPIALCSVFFNKNTQKKKAYDLIIFPSF